MKTARLFMHSLRPVFKNETQQQMSVPGSFKYIAVAALAALVGGLLGWFRRDFAPAPSNITTVASFHGWRVACLPRQQADRSCQMREDLVDPKSHTEVAHLLISKRGGATVLAVTVPYDVLLQSGLGLSLDGGKVQAYPYQTCDNVGCVARIPFNDKLRNNLCAAQQGRLLFAGMDTKVTSLSFSLQGFGAAEAAFASGPPKRFF